jgi:hypothetical protein
MTSGHEGSLRIDRPHAVPAGEVLRELNSAEDGLTPEQAAAR